MSKIQRRLLRTLGILVTLALLGLGTRLLIHAIIALHS
jgi:hypothetical protein